jgi:hypothetical protein
MQRQDAEGKNWTAFCIPPFCILHSAFCIQAAPFSAACYPTVNGALALIVPHSILSVPPAAVSSIEIVSCSTGADVLPTVIGTRPRSSPSGYGMPQPFSRLLMISCHSFSPGRVWSP